MIRIMITGDYSPMGRCDELLQEGKYEDVFGEIKDVISYSDYAITNFESTIASKTSTPIDKYGPVLRCDEYAVEAAKYAGFGMFTLANNHFYDYGDEGVDNSLTAFIKHGIDFVGAGRSIQEAQRIFYKKIKNKTIAFINCCEHEFSIATLTKGGCNPLNAIQQYYDIVSAQKADYKIIIIHGGNEHFQFPSPRMKETYRFFIDCGADAVINHHQHCYSGYEIYNDKPIFYGIGNLCFDWEGRRNSLWNEGYIVELLLENSQVRFNILPYIQGNDKAGIQMVTNPIQRQNFISTITRINNIIDNDQLLQEEYEKWISTSSKPYLLALEPYVGRFLSSLYNSNMLPSFITKGRCLRLSNFINCESHLDRLRHILNHKTQH